MEQSFIQRAFELLSRFQFALENTKCTTAELIDILGFDPVPEHMITEDGLIWLNVQDSRSVAMDLITFDQYLFREISKRFYEIEKLILGSYVDDGDTSYFSGTLKRLTDVIEQVSDRYSLHPFSNDKINEAVLTGFNYLSATCNQFSLSLECGGVKPKGKIQWNIPPGAMAYFFKQLISAQRVDGESVFINLNRSDMVRLICDNFVDDKGKPYSIRTMETGINENGGKPDAKKKIIDVSFGK